MKVFSVLSFLVILVGCATADVRPKPTVSPNSVSEVLEVLESKDYHRITRVGGEVFKQGLYVPNHAELFRGYPSSAPRQGQIRYVLYSFHGEASAGEVYLILDGDSGEIIEFSYFEALFE